MIQLPATYGGVPVLKEGNIQQIKKADERMRGHRSSFTGLESRGGNPSSGCNSISASRRNSIERLRKEGHCDSPYPHDVEDQMPIKRSEIFRALKRNSIQPEETPQSRNESPSSAGRDSPFAAPGTWADLSVVRWITDPSSAAAAPPTDSSRLFRHPRRSSAPHVIYPAPQSSSPEMAGYEREQEVLKASSSKTQRRPRAKSITPLPNKKIVDELTLDTVMRKPIQCGYLLKFTEADRTSESIRFALDVEDLKEKLIRKKYRSRCCSVLQSMDEMLASGKVEMVRLANTASSPAGGLNNSSGGGFESKSKYSHNHSGIHVPPPFLPEMYAGSQGTEDRNFEKYVISCVVGIWENYLKGPTATFEVLITEDVRRNTRARLERFDLYGCDAFAEAIEEPLKNLRCDVFPRFLRSPMCDEMRDKVEHLRYLADGNSPISTREMKAKAALAAAPQRTLFLPNEGSNSNSRKVSQGVDDGKIVSVDQILKDPEHFQKLQTYLIGIHREWCLLCVRMVMNYEDLVLSCAATTTTGIAEGGGRGVFGDDDSFSSATETAWRIYESFLADGCPYPVKLSTIYAKDIKLQMAQPKGNTFRHLKIFAMDELIDCFEKYTGHSNGSCDPLESTSCTQPVPALRRRSSWSIPGIFSPISRRNSGAACGEVPSRGSVPGIFSPGSRRNSGEQLGSMAASPLPTHPPTPSPAARDNHHNTQRKSSTGSIIFTGKEASLKALYSASNWLLNLVPRGGGGTASKLNEAEAQAESQRDD